MTTTLADLLAGVDMEGGENFCDSVYNFLKNQGKDINLITNSGFGVWSQSDANKGLGYLDFDSGSVAPVVGETLTDAISGATGKVIYFTVSAGTWGGGNAAGTVYLGACSPDCFNNNATVNGSVGGANMMTVNQPDGAVGTDGLVENGAFVDNIDPPNDWAIMRGDETLTTEAAGAFGNCIMITEGALANAGFKQTITTVVGKIYKFSYYVKQGTEATYKARIDDSGTLHNNVTREATAAWVQHSFTFEAVSASCEIQIYMIAAGGGGLTIYFDEITLYEITPCCTAADNVAFDGWYKNQTTLDLYRQHNDGGTLTKDGSFYSLRVVPTAGAEQFCWNFNTRNLAEFYQQFAGRTLTVGVWAKTSTASHFKLRIYDTAYNDSSYHTGGGAWEWIELTVTINATPTQMGLYFHAVQAGAADGSTIVYVSQPMLVFGSCLGEGMYQPRLQEIIWLETYIDSNKLQALTGQSSTAWTDINVEADTDGKLPKGCKAINPRVTINDSGSAANNNIEMYLRSDVVSAAHFIISCSGLTNDFNSYAQGWQRCDLNGDFDYYVAASGAGTFDITFFRYQAVQLN